MTNEISRTALSCQKEGTPDCVGPAVLDACDHLSSRGPQVAVLTVIEPKPGWRGIELGELWRYRELLYFLTWRDVKVRYKQTVLGAAWAILQPVLAMVVFTVFFGKLGRLEQHVDVPYPIFVYAALLPWTFFANGVTTSGQSLVNQSRLISKIYFPRLLVPMSSVGAGLVDLAISFCVLLALMVGYGVSFGWGLLLVPFLVAGTVIAALGIGFVLAALTVAYRDFRYVIPFMVQMGMFVSPVAYPFKVIPEEWRLLYSLNPMAGIISGFRSAILNEPFRLDCLGVSLAAALLTFVAGAFYFRRVERRFADIV